MKLHYTCTVKARNILKAKNALVKSEYCVTEYTVCSPVIVHCSFLVIIRGFYLLPPLVCGHEVYANITILPVLSTLFCFGCKMQDRYFH
jgi:hypothetical protein